MPWSAAACCCRCWCWCAWTAYCSSCADRPRSSTSSATTQQALHLLERMQTATPRGETFSAGVALCDPHADLANALDAADAALYEAKQAGRHRIHIGGTTPPLAAPTPITPIPTVL
ncbi:diguanylate cyclase [Rhodanobacter sp. K2T2]|uniref:diguanylate cyclase domain-containing protein n=1 Tax=Rhodanobacter sp. K2T2 TaxID=2723085 RepID=UPI002106C1EA|nr:diguanylate cyclase [Rhodanobacter sp. K2T2]